MAVVSVELQTIIRLFEKNDYLCATSYEDCISIWFVNSQLQFDNFYTFPGNNEDMPLLQG